MNKLTTKYNKKTNAYSFFYNDKPFMILYPQDEYATYDTSTLSYRDPKGVYQAIKLKIPTSDET